MTYGLESSPGLRLAPLPDMENDQFEVRRRRQRSPRVVALTQRSSLASTWQMDVWSRIFDLTELKANWDSYGASVPTVVAGEALMDVLRYIMTADTPTPFIAPTPEGHFQAEWHMNGVDLEVEVVAPAKVIVSYSGRRPDWDVTLTHDLSALRTAIDELTE